RALDRLSINEDDKLGFAALRAPPVVLADTGAHPRTGASSGFGGNLKALGGVAGYSAFPLDSDGVLRHMQYETNHLKSFAIVAAQVATGRTIPASELHGETAWIDYSGPSGTVPVISFSRVLRHQFKPAQVRGK